MMIPGIDAGNSRIKIAIPDAVGHPQLFHNECGEPYTPSVVYFAPDGKTIVGTEAANSAFAEPGRVVFDWKRHMGTDKVLYREGSVEYRARDILRILLEHAKAQIEAKTNQPIQEVVIGIPANYDDAQRQDTLEAAAQAGLKVLCLVHEPTAAALGNGVHKGTNETDLVYDFGGCTFDVSIVQVQGNSTKILATSGEPHLGGQDFNARIKSRVLEQFETENGFIPSPEDDPIFYQDLDFRIETLKTTLSVKEQASIVISSNGHLLNMKMPRNELDFLVQDLVQKSIDRTLQTLKDANLSVSQIDRVFAVGGASLMPLVSQELEKALGKKPSRHCEPYYAAAYGAVWASRIEYQRLGRTYTLNNVALPPPNIVMREVTSHPVGVCALSEDNRLVCSEILPKHVPIPSQQVKLFRLVEAKQTAALIELLQGEEGKTREQCLVLGHFPLENLPPDSDLTGRIEITFALDINGILKATARDLISGQTQELQIDYKRYLANKPGA